MDGLLSRKLLAPHRFHECSYGGIARLMRTQWVIWLVCKGLGPKLIAWDWVIVSPL